MMKSITHTGAHTRASEINVLIACEESQAEMSAFLALGFNAYSCDIKPCRKKGDVSRHILGDVTPLLHGEVHFYTMDDVEHTVSRWHLIIAHPPCTYLCKLGAVHLYEKPDYTIWQNGVAKYINKQRFDLMQNARKFFYDCLNAQADYVAVENPIPMRLANLPRPDCYVHPAWFGVKYTKKTLYWLKNLPPVMPTLIYPNPKCFVRASRGMYRSRTFPQVAKALAEQWGEYILDNMK